MNKAVEEENVTAEIMKLLMRFSVLVETESKEKDDVREKLSECMKKLEQLDMARWREYIDYIDDVITEF